MSVLVVDVRIMRVVVGQGAVGMLMRMRLSPIPAETVGMAVVLLMNVTVRVRNYWMGMHVLVPLL